MRDQIEKAISQGETKERILDALGVCLEETNHIKGVYKGRGGYSEVVIRTKELSAREIREHRDRIFDRYSTRYLERIETEEDF